MNHSRTQKNHRTVALHQTRRPQGFTLIELLVVIAIIAILSSVVLASLNTARAKGTDAAIRSQLKQLQSQAELVYDAAGNYGPNYSSGGNAAACPVAVGATLFATTSPINVALLVTSMINTAGGRSNTYCASSGTAWAMAVNLKTDNARSWCVDSRGLSMLEDYIAVNAIASYACK